MRLATGLNEQCSLFIFKKLMFFQILFQICVLQSRVNMGQKHFVEESILIDIGNHLNRRKSSYLSKCGYVAQEDFSIPRAK